MTTTADLPISCRVAVLLADPSLLLAAQR